MKSCIFVLTSLILIGASATFAQDFSKFEPMDFTAEVDAAVKKIDAIANAGPFKPDWESLETYEAPEWYHDAKLGIFIHWGVYSVPAFGSEWYPRNMYIEKDGWPGRVYRHHVEKHGEHLAKGYKDFIPAFTAPNFNADEWASLFKESGAKYVIPVAEHHDGFPMYDCTFTQWSSVKMGPKRDIVKELRDAVREKDLYFGVSSHRAFNWLYFIRNKNFDSADPRFAGLYGRPIPELFEEDAANYKDNWPKQDRQFKDEWLARTGELVDKYDPDIIWFDFGIGNKNGLSPYENHYQEHLKRFAAYYYNLAAKAKKRVPVINYKWTAMPEKAAVLDLERSKLDDIRKGVWQTDTSVATNSWCHVEGIKYKPVDRLIDDLVDIVSKNGCLLLNVCPKADGTIPDHQKEMLREIGAWLKINGEAIYASRPFTIFGEGPTGTATGHLSENKNKPFGPKDIRFTTKGDVLYAIVLAIPEDGVVNVETLKSGNKLRSEYSKVSLLGYDQDCDWKQTDSALTIKLPEQLPSKFALVFKIQ